MFEQRIVYVLVCLIQRSHSTCGRAVIVLLNVGRGEHMVSSDTPIDPNYSV